MRILHARHLVEDVCRPRIIGTQTLPVPAVNPRIVFLGGKVHGSQVTSGDTNPETVSEGRVRPRIELTVIITTQRPRSGRPRLGTVGRQSQMPQDAAHDLRMLDERHQPQPPAAPRARRSRTSAASTPPSDSRRLAPCRKPPPPRQPFQPARRTSPSRPTRRPPPHRRASSAPDERQNAPQRVRTHRR